MSNPVDPSRRAASSKYGFTPDVSNWSTGFDDDCHPRRLAHDLEDGKQRLLYAAREERSLTIVDTLPADKLQESQRHIRRRCRGAGGNLESNVIDAYSDILRRYDRKPDIIDADDQR